MIESHSSSNFVQHFVSRTPTTTERLTSLLTRCRSFIIVVFVPLLFAPLLTFHKPEFNCAYCVCVVAAYWMSEVMPLAVTAMLPVVLFPLCGVLDANTTAKEYMNDTNFLFIGGLIMAAAVEKCDLHERVALSVLRLVGSDPKWIMLGFMVVTALLSSFISNTATTAMMVPIGQSVINQLVVSFNNHPHHGSKSKEGCAKMSTGLVLSICIAANIGGTGTATGTPSNLVMLGQLSTLYPLEDGSLNYVTWIFFAYPLMLICLAIAWITLVVFFLRNAPERDEHVTQMLHDRYEKLPKMSYAEKSVCICFSILLSLWMFRNPGVFTGFGVFFKKGNYTDATSAMIVAFLLFLLPAEKPNLSTYIKSEDLKKRNCLMDWKTMQEVFPWSVVLLLGGGFALAAGVKESGLSHLIGDCLSSIEHLPIWLLQILTMLIAMLITNICSNTVTASIFVPIVATVAQQSGNHPFTLMLPTTLAASFAFVLPVGTPPNAIVFGSGMVKVSDMAFVGLIMSLEMLAVTVVYMNTMAPFVLDIGQIPAWATAANSTLTI